MHPRTIMSFSHRFGQPFMVLHFASFVRRPTGAHALQARRICPVGRARRKDTSYRHQGTGVENPRLPQRCTRSRRRPASPGGGRRSETASGARPGAPSCPGRHCRGRLLKFHHAASLIAHSAAPGGFQHKVSCPRAAPAKRPSLDCEETACARPGGRQRDCGSDRARRNPAAPRSLGESRHALARPVDNRVRQLARRRPAGPGPTHWRRRAAPLRFCS